MSVPASAADPGEEVMLQRLALPEPGEEARLCLSGGTPTGTGLRLSPGELCDLGSWMNLFWQEVWQETAARMPEWRLQGSGRLRVELYHPLPPEQRRLRPRTRKAERPETRVRRRLLATVEVDLDRSALSLPLPPGVPLLGLRLTALTRVQIDGGGVVARAPLDRDIRLALVITTWRREAQAQASAARLSALLASGQMPGAHLFLIDNGQSLSLPPLPHVSQIANRNLGGAGGFARGLAEARARGFSHCLFMDDDATCRDEAILRCHRLLQLARRADTAVAGAMLTKATPWKIWEMGARFDGLCQPLHHGTDLRDPAALARMLSAPARGKGLYGGWWFFAFPLAPLRHDPFPFFLRGDDSGFALANRFHLLVLNGIAAIQEGFDAKQSPLTAYLDLRYHLHHLLVQPGMARSARLLVPLRLVIRDLLAMRYDSAQAALLAWADVMQGPAHFESHVDLGDRRERIAALTRDELWQDGRPAMPPPLPPSPLPRRWQGVAMRLLLNGHCLPFWRSFGARRQLPADCRGLLWLVWGAAELRYIAADAGTAVRSMTLRHDKRRFWGLMARMLRLWLLWVLRTGALQREFRRDHARLTSPRFWQDQFGGGA